MIQKHGFHVGVLEIGGIGLAAGVLGGVIASVAGFGAFDTVVPCATACGVVGVPMLWFSAGIRLSRVIRRSRGARAVASRTGLVA